MVAWFAVLALAGIAQVINQPRVLAALCQCRM
jgi:K+ transporter